MTKALLSSSILLSLCLVACGGPGPARTANDTVEDEEDDDSYVDEEPEEDGEIDGSFVDSTLLRNAGEPFELGEAVVVPGTGVTMRPPAGSRSIPGSAGFLAMRHRVQIAVVVAMGDREILEAIRTGGSQNAPEPEEVEEVEVSGQTGRIGRDQMRSQAGVLERSWLLVHDGERALGVVATYEQSRAATVRRGIRDVLGSVVWNREAPIDAGAALGLAIGPIEGLAATNRSSANMVMTEPGAPFPPSAGQPILTIAPLPMQVPPDQIAAACEQLAARLVPAPPENVTLEGVVEDGNLPGCERLATAQTQEGDEVVAYMALLFNNGMPILVNGNAPADQVDVWRPRFAAAARTVRGHDADGDED